MLTTPAPSPSPGRSRALSLPAGRRPGVGHRPQAGPGTEHRQETLEIPPVRAPRGIRNGPRPDGSVVSAGRHPAAVGRKGDRRQQSAQRIGGHATMSGLIAQLRKGLPKSGPRQPGEAAQPSSSVSVSALSGRSRGPARATTTTAGGSGRSGRKGVSGPEGVDVPGIWLLDPAEAPRHIEPTPISCIIVRDSSNVAVAPGRVSMLTGDHRIVILDLLARIKGAVGTNDHE